MRSTEIFNQYNLFAFEGIDGCGKSTIIRNIELKLNNKGYKTAIIPRFSYPQISNLWFDMVSNDILDHYTCCQLSGLDFNLTQKNIIYKKIENNFIILCDRYVYSHYIYYSLRHVPSFVFWAFFTKNYLVPTYTFLIQLSSESALQNITKTGQKISFWETGFDCDCASRVAIGRLYRGFLETLPSEDLIHKQFLNYQQSYQKRLIQILKNKQNTKIIDGEKTIKDLVEIIYNKIRKKIWFD